MPRLSFSQETWSRAETVGEPYAVSEANSLLNSILTELVTLRQLVGASNPFMPGDTAADKPPSLAVNTGHAVAPNDMLLEDLSGLLDS